MDVIAAKLQKIVKSPGTALSSSEDEDTAPLCPPSHHNHGSTNERHSHGPSNNNLNHYDRHDSENSEIAPRSGDTASHCHYWWPIVDFSEDATAIRQLVFVSVLCFVFMTAQIIGGALANSLSIMTDAAHLSSDLASFLISILALYLKRRRPTKRFSYGYHRVETLGALTSILVIWLLSAILCIFAVERIQRHEYDINANEMLIVASLGVAFNIVMGIVLHSDFLGSAQKFINHGHSHGGSTSASENGHGHSHHSQNHDHNHNHSHGSAHSRNLNIRAAFIHVIGDLVQSIGVLIAAILIKINADWKIADPICTFIFSVIVLATTFTVLRDIVLILVEAVPNDVDYDFVKKELSDLPNVSNVHNLHIWSLSTSSRHAIVHLTINDPSADRTFLIRAATLILVKQADVKAATVQIEESSSDSTQALADGTLGFVDNFTALHMDCDHCRRFTPM